MVYACDFIHGMPLTLLIVCSRISDVLSTLLEGVRLVNLGSIPLRLSFLFNKRYVRGLIFHVLPTLSDLVKIKLFGVRYSHMFCLYSQSLCTK